MMRSLFTEHPASVDETYTEHLGVAFGFSLRMCLGGLACLVHAFLPFLFVKTGSETSRSCTNAWSPIASATSPAAWRPAPLPPPPNTETAFRETAARSPQGTGARSERRPIPGSRRSLAPGARVPRRPRRGKVNPPPEREPAS